MSRKESTNPKTVQSEILPLRTEDPLGPCRQKNQVRILLVNFSYVNSSYKLY